jgi:hypothetical protein
MQVGEGKGHLGSPSRPERKGDREPHVPPLAPENDIARIVTPLKASEAGDGHVSPYQITVPVFATNIHRSVFAGCSETTVLSDRCNKNDAKRFLHIDGQQCCVSM